MRRFDINGFKENPKRMIMTSDGNDVEVVYTGLKTPPSRYNNLAVEHRGDIDGLVYFDDDGDTSDGRYLIFRPEETSLYVNVYKCACNDTGYIITAPYSDREKAVDTARNMPDYLATGTLTFTID